MKLLPKNLGMNKNYLDEPRLELGVKKDVETEQFEAGITRK
jgi:hypothetical protein